MDRREFLKLSGLAAGTVLIGENTLGKMLVTPGIGKTDRPNILFIMTDQQSFNMMSCMGNKYLSTPNMDSIVTRGYRFEKTYCSNPVCMPSRFSLLTGHYASEVGVKHNTPLADIDKVQEITKQDALGNIFAEAGYQTLYSGKTHLYGTQDLSEYGFELNGRDPYEGPAIYAEKILAEYGSGKHKKPFFLFLSFMNPHDICYKAGMDKRYPDELSEAQIRETKRLLEYKNSLSEEEYKKQIPPPVANRSIINGEQDEMVNMSTQAREWTEDQWNLYNWMYHRLTESVDVLIGRVLTALKKSGLDDKTIIVFTADHGDMHGAHSLILKNVMFEECQRVPFVFAGKGIATNYADKKSLVCNGLDFIPTICELAGLHASDKLPGVSLYPQLTGKSSKAPRKFLITEGYNSFQISDGRYKYTMYELTGYPELLTDLVQNPGETINYAEDPAYASVKENLKKALLGDLTRRGLTPLSQNRSIREIRKSEKARKGELKANKGNKGKKTKSSIPAEVNED